ncbi:hypothetical protein ALC62_00551, partial [Cyphomyrmex costatus]
DETSVTKIWIDTKNPGGNIMSRLELAEECISIAIVKRPRRPREPFPLAQGGGCRGEMIVHPSRLHSPSLPHPTALAPGTHRPRDHLLHVGARVE